MPVTVALTIAGSDSSGGAGIQADLKTMSAFGVFGATALTAITAQNTKGVASSLMLAPEFVAAQIDAVFEDLPVGAAKTGMLGGAQTVEAVADRVGAHGLRKLVVDPVMVATSGSSLIEEGAVGAMVRALLPLALVVTPNIPEAETLSGLRVVTEKDMEKAARAIHDLGPRYVLLKGGHLTDSALDLLFDGSTFLRFTGERIPGGRIHGTGCTLSAAIASGLALGRSVEEAVGEAKRYVTAGIATALPFGGGSDFVNHFACLEDED